MKQLVGFLYQQRSQDAQLAQQLGLLELPNLLALLDWLPGHAETQQIVHAVGRIEHLLAPLARATALARAVAVREAAAAQIDEWSNAQFEHERLGIERLLAAGDLNRAYQAAAALQQRALAAGETAYSDADYDIAYILWLYGRVLKTSGQAGAALQPLAEAQRRFQTLADVGNASAARMAGVSITEEADCLRAVGRLDDAVEAYEEAVKRSKQRDDARSVAVNNGQLGTVRMLQERYTEALAAYEGALAIFEDLGEPGAVATIWHQIGRVHSQTRQFEAAERAYRLSLAIEVGQNNRAGQAGSLNELGNLYNAWGRPEQAVTFYRQAADIYTALGDQAFEGRARNNIAGTLHKLGRNDEARREILRAIECKQAFGHATLPWTSFAILQDIEQAVGTGAAAAWRQARDACLAYRREGVCADKPRTNLRSNSVSYPRGRSVCGQKIDQ